MLSALTNSFKIPDLKRRLIITGMLLAVYRLGCYVPTPGIDGGALVEFFSRIAKTQGGALFGIINMFSGGAMERLTVFALGIMPYISSSIIMQLLTAVIPALEKLSKEGRAGYEKINQFTRYGTVVLAVIQSFFIAVWLENPAHFQGLQIAQFPGWSFRILTVITLTCGTAFIMWLGEQIQEYGIGNGMSLIITAGIVSRIPTAIYQLWSLFSPFAPEKAQLEPFTLIIMIVLLVAVVVAVIVVTQGQRKIPVQYAKRVVGRKIYGGQATFLPLRVNQAGVIPIIFAMSLMLFPGVIAQFFAGAKTVLIANIAKSVEAIFKNQIFFSSFYFLLVVAFTYFYTSIIFKPDQIAENVQKQGGFIPGFRPGSQTAGYLSNVVNRITLAGALFLGTVAILPFIMQEMTGIKSLVIGGTGLLIVVSVAIEFMKQIEAQLVMKSYENY